MSSDRRRSVVIAVLALIAGAGIGAEIIQRGVAVDPNLVLWVAALGGGALLVTLILVPAAAAEAMAAPSGTVNAAAWAEFRRELRRTRRGARPMTLIRIPGPAMPTVAEMDSLTMRCSRFAQHLRLVDRAWVDDGSIYVLLPESSREAAEILLGRVASAAPDLVPTDIRVATFPDDGLTSGALIAAIHGTTLAEVPTPIRAALADTADEPDFEAETVSEAAAR